MNEKEIQQAIALLEAAGYEVIPPQITAVLDNEFEKWWQLYDKKRGKEKCQKKWARMTKKDREACIMATPRYVASITNKVYQKDPLTYLNGRAWEDEIYTEYDEYQSNKQELTFAATVRRTLEAD